jgi:hypothetical protein
MKVKAPREKSTAFFKSKKFLTSLIGFFIIMIMALSALDLWKGSGDSYTYHNTKFTKQDTGWLAYVGSAPVLLAYSPQELENVTDVDFSSFNSLQKIYIVSDDPQAMYRSIDYFRKKIPLSPLKTLACTPEAYNVTECADLPLKDCKDADNTVGVIMFQKADAVSASFITNTCLEIKGTNDELVKVIDKSMLKMAGV